MTALMPEVDVDLVDDLDDGDSLPSFPAAPGKWVNSALCAEIDPELWFPEQGGLSAPARRMCHRCPVVQDCLDYALETAQQWGVWGGATASERKRMLAGDLPALPPLYAAEDAAYAAGEIDLRDLLDEVTVDIDDDDAALPWLADCA